MNSQLLEEVEGKGPWEVIERLRQIEAAEVVERVGKSPNDPRAYWTLRFD